MYKVLTQKSNIVFLTFILLNWNIVYGQTWDVPTEIKTKVSSFKFTKTTVKDGEAIYTKNCQPCHGNPGKANFLETLDPTPPDPAGDKMQQNTDGEIFYKLSEGKNIMPSFEDILTEKERWNVIAYIRSFNNKTYKQLTTGTNELSKRVNIAIQFDITSYLLTVKVKAATKKDSVSLADAEATLFVARYFGKMKIDSSLRTNKEGVAVFHFPKVLPGDKTGMVNISVKITDDKYGEIEKSQSLKIGVPTDVPSLTEQRALWNVVSKTPWWLLITYTAVVGVIWFFLIYIILKLFKIRKLGKNAESK